MVHPIFESLHELELSRTLIWFFLLLLCFFTIGTPLWRNGPLDKPVLCNACGSRWRTKGTLLNYTPLHARADPTNFKDNSATQVKSVSTNKNIKIKILNRKYEADTFHANEGFPLDYSLGPPILAEEEMSNPSSSGSVMSNSDLHFENADASDLTGAAQSVVLDSVVTPRKRKRSGVICMKPSSVEKLTKDLRAIMNEQPLSRFSESSDGDLLFESATPMCSFEIGHGTVILRNHSSVTREEESEASSHSVDQKLHKASVSYLHALDAPSHRDGKIGDFACPIPRDEKNKTPVEHGSGQHQLKSNISQDGNLQILGNHNPTLAAVNIKDNIDVDELMKYLTCDEELLLLKYLPFNDKAQLANSLRRSIDSSEFKESLSTFPELLAEFSGSFSGAKVEDYKNLKKLILFCLMRQKELESHFSFEEYKNSSISNYTGLSKLQTTESSILVGSSEHGEVQNQNFSEARMVNGKRLSMKGSFEKMEMMDNVSPCINSGSLFAFLHDGSVLMPDSSPLLSENSHQDLLLDIPSNGWFPQAELLPPAKH
ncbi:hypothetical protein SAY86_000678 [Trapa natans]|uniref:GATA-type domain-containing protein n=1 Tax=Trapa natans TaxID=22666 RepID=A0AAN7RGV5_TRANT|nr:hypothetical protein SAY86_000678 [Trapa natans]